MLRVIRHSITLVLMEPRATLTATSRNRSDQAPITRSETRR